MKTIAKFIFKVHKKIYGYPMRSEVRLVIQELPSRNYSLTYTVGLLYICGESIDDLCEWHGLSKQDIIDLLNEFVETYKCN